MEKNLLFKHDEVIFSSANSAQLRAIHLMMNAELVAAEESRIIIPTVYREDYLLTLRRLTRSHEPEPYIKMLVRAQEFTASIQFDNYEAALQQLRQSNAFKQLFEGKLNIFHLNHLNNKEIKFPLFLNKLLILAVYNER